ncbi:MAG: AraC family transcriptional regulator [Sedimenticola sp.]|nr:AraC family transcriptional regulator [Sedimenticola sp.]
MLIKHSFDGFTISATIHNYLIDSLNRLRCHEQNDYNYPVPFEKAGCRVSLLKAYSLFNELKECYPDSDLGIWLARGFTPRKANIIGSLFMETRNLRESMEMMHRYLKLLTNNVTFTVTEYKNSVVFNFDVEPKKLLHSSVTEFYIFACYFWALRYTGDKTLSIKKAFFNYDEPAHAYIYQQLEPEMEMYFGQAKNSLLMERSAFYRENINYSAKRQQSLLARAGVLIDTYNGRKDYSTQVVRQIHYVLPGERPTIESVSKEMRVTSRTLRRKLKEEGYTFRDLLDSVRKELAKSMLNDRQLRIEEIAYFLGYDEYTSFSRAFRKWFGIPPSQYL